jgi:hypothetical protein
LPAAAACCCFFFRGGRKITRLDVFSPSIPYNVSAN